LTKSVMMEKAEKKLLCDKYRIQNLERMSSSVSGEKYMEQSTNKQTRSLGFGLLFYGQM
jgi:hypothetical protein